MRRFPYFVPSALSLSSFAFPLVPVALLVSAATVGGLGCYGRTAPLTGDPEELTAEGPDASVIVPADGGVVRTDSPVVVVVDGSRPSPPDGAGPLPFPFPTIPDGFTLPWDAPINIWEILPPFPDTGVIGGCASCVRDSCGSQVNACINDLNCLRGLTCSVSTCLTGGTGGFDFSCLSKCFGSDMSSMMKAMGAFTCVTGKCGATCGAILGGGLGGLGGGGGSTPPSPGPAPSGSTTPKPIPPPSPSSSPGGGSGGGRLPAADFATPPAPIGWGVIEGIVSMSEVSLAQGRLRSVDPSTRLTCSVEAFAPWATQINASAAEQGLGAVDFSQK